MTPSSLHLKHNSIPLQAHAVSGTKLLWRCDAQRRASESSDDAFLRDYSLVLKGSFFVDEKRLADAPLSVTAERYGGSAIGENGGGARVVNVGNVQLKGVGANALVGCHAPTTHSYGGLDAQGALQEIITSRLAHRILPHHSQQIFGLILLDYKSALYDSKPTWSTILVRERCDRPAHFVRCHNFRVQPQFAELLQPDELRIRRMYTDFEKHLGPSAFVRLLSDFLDKSADQLSFCRMARFAHSVLSDSNIALDGRFLDTSLCGFVHSGINFCQVSDFYTEPSIPPRAVEEMVYNYNKYNFTRLEATTLQADYATRFEQYLALNAGFIFGIPRAPSLQLTNSNNWGRVVALLHRIICSGNGEKAYALPSLDIPDPLNEILAAALYCAVHDTAVSKAPPPLHGIVDLVCRAVSEIHALYVDDFPSRSTFLKALSIQTFKRNYLSSFFYLTYITRLVEDTISSSPASYLKNVVESIDGVIEWVFEDLGPEKVTLFRSPSASIEFSTTDGQFVAHDHDERVFASREPEDLLHFLKQSTINFKVLHYNFKPFLIRVAAFFFGDAEASFRGASDVL